MCSIFLNLLSSQAFLPLLLKERKVLNLFFMFYTKPEVTKLTLKEASSTIQGVTHSQLSEILLKLQNLNIIKGIAGDKFTVVKDGETLHSLKELVAEAGFDVVGVLLDSSFNKMYYLNLNFEEWKYSKNLKLVDYIQNYSFKGRGEKEVEEENHLVKRFLTYFCEKHQASYSISYKVFPTDIKTLKDISHSITLNGLPVTEVFNLIDSCFSKRQNAKFVRIDWLKEDMDSFITTRNQASIKGCNSHLKTNWKGEVWAVSN